MKSLLHSIALICTGIAAMQGCSPSQYIIPEDDAFATLFWSNRIFHPAGEPVQAVFQSPQEWQWFIDRYPTRDRDEATRGFSQVNYSDYMVIGIILGSRGSGGHSVRIDSIKAEEGVMKVYSHEYYPSIQTRVTTNPAHFVVVEKRGLDVLFEPVQIVKEK